MSYAQEQPDSGMMLLKSIGIVVAMFAVAFWIIPPVRNFILLLFTLTRAAESALVFQVDKASELMRFAGFLVDNLSSTHIKFSEACRVINQTGAPAWISGLVATALTSFLAVKTWMKTGQVSEKQVIKQITGKSLEETCADWDVDPEIFRMDKKLSREENLERIARAFNEVRKKKNIPPNIFARKVTREIAPAISYFNKINENGEIFVIISDPEELERRLKEQFSKS